MASRYGFFGGFRLVCLGSTALCLVTSVQPALSQPQQKIEASQADRARLSNARQEFTIPAGPLDQALRQWSEASKLKIFVLSALLAGKSTAGVTGHLTPESALKQLLAGTNLTFENAGPKTLSIFDPAPGYAAYAQAIALDTITVEGKQNPNAVLGNLPPPYAGGQVATGGQVGFLGNRSVMDTPFSQTSYTSELIQNQQAISIADVVANDPSVRRSFAPSSFLDEYTIRGFTFYNRDIAFNGLYGMLPFNSIPAEIAERVEVLKGPNALLNGMAPSGSIGGAINIIPKRATDNPITRFTTGYNSDTQFYEHVDLGRRFGEHKEFGVRINGVYRKGNTSVDNNSQEMGLATLGFDYRTDRFRFDADLGYQKRNVNAPQSLLFPGTVIPTIKAPSAETNFFQPWTYYDTTHKFVTSRAELDITENITAYAAFGASREKSDSIQTNWTLQNSAGLIRASPSYLESDDKVATGEAGLRANFDTGPFKHKVAFSYSKFDWNSYGVTLSSLRGFVFSNVFNPVTAANPAFTPVVGGLPKVSDVNLSSVAVADTISLADERIQVTLGVRRQNVGTASYATTGALTADYDDAATTPAIGVVVRPTQNLSIYANYIEGLMPGGIAPQTAANAGEVFAPFVSKQKEVGIKWEQGGFGATLAAFRITLPSAFTIPGTTIYTVDGEQINRGVEFTTFGEITKSIRLLGGVMYLDGTQARTAGGINDGKVAIAAPEWNVNIGTEWDAPFLNGLTFSARTIYTSSQYVNAANTIDIPEWYRFDIGARYKTVVNGTPVTLRANVENLFNDGYWSSASRGRLIQGAPRTFFASATFDF